jgi:hypothetical protein
MERPKNCKRIHFSLNGTIALTKKLPPDLLRTGDTASGSDPDDLVTLFWRCTVSRDRIAWTEVEPWTEERADEYVADADMMCIVTDSQITVSQLTKTRGES